MVDTITQQQHFTNDWLEQSYVQQGLSFSRHNTALFIDGTMRCAPGMITEPQPAVDCSVACCCRNSCFQWCLVMLHVRVNTKHRNNLTFHVKWHFVGKVQLNSETNLCGCKDLKVTKNVGKFHCWYVPRPCWKRTTKHIAYYINNMATCPAVFFTAKFCTFLPCIT